MAVDPFDKSFKGSNGEFRFFGSSTMFHHNCFFNINISKK